MATPENNYQVVYRGEYLKNFKPGGWVFFQRAKEHGGGYWLGRTYEGVFVIEYERPISLYDGIGFVMLVTEMEKKNDFENVKLDEPDNQLPLF